MSAAPSTTRSKRFCASSAFQRWVWIGSTMLGCTLSLLAGLAATTQHEDLITPYSLQPTVDPQTQNAPDRPELDAETYARIATQLRSQYAMPPEHWPKPTVGNDVQFVELGVVPVATYPEDNPYSLSKAELGKILFFDPRLSGSHQMACASCHEPDLAWADGRTVSFGNHRLSLKRNSPSLLNVAHGQSMFWDGRVKTLEEQALTVIQNPEELNASLDQVVERMRNSPEYTKLFQEAFGDQPISADLIAKALATFQRTIRSTGRSDFDRFLAGRPDQLSDSAMRGLHLFRTAAGCANCHHGPLLTDHQFHNIGLSYYGRKYQDLGRYEVTKQPQDVGAFKTPSLRNVTKTAPYMHLGMFQLRGVLNMYNAGMPTLKRKPEQANDPLFPVKSHLLRPLGLNEQDLTDLEAFLQALEEPYRRVRPPESLPAIIDNPVTSHATP